MTAANIDVSHEQSTKKVKSTDLEEITDKSTPLIVWGVPDSKELRKHLLLLQIDSNSSSEFSFLFKLHVLLWWSYDWIWGNILAQGSHLNFVLTSTLTVDSNLSFSCY